MSIAEQTSAPVTNIMRGDPADETLDELKVAVRMLIQGAQSDLRDRHNVDPSIAGNYVLYAIVEEVDDHLDLPSNIVDPVLNTIFHNVPKHV